MNKNRHSHNHLIKALLLALLTMLPIRGFAQFGITDPASLEAMIGNHKKVRTILEIRAATELGVYNMHKSSSGAVQDYEKVHNQIDRYKRYFDMINLILNCAYTAFHGIRAYNTCRDNIKGYVGLLDDYADKILKDRKLMPSDTIIYTTSLTAIGLVQDDIKALYTSFTDLAAYMTGAMECSTFNLMLILNSINTSFDNLERNIQNAYLNLWSYMTLRLGYWKTEIFAASRTIKEIAESALATWRKSQDIAYQVLISKTPIEHKPLGGRGLLGGGR